ncbi:MAG TPA: VOC family protein [Magnetospirillaceae bacterium]|jgi:catechol 2,3-dioxygenase-like lactoylglutathione lyase family enzyme
MLDHMGFAVRDFAKSKAFYQKTLAPLGIAIVKEVTPEQSGGYTGAGFGDGGKPYFWIGAGKDSAGSHNVHVAFVAPDRKTVDAFYKAAMAAGGSDNGGPGLRPHYHPNYYGAFVHDPEGNNVEAVCHKPE